MSDKFITINQITIKISRSKSVIYRLINNGEFPPPIKIGRGSVWPESEIDAWMQDLINRSRAA